MRKRPTLRERDELAAAYAAACRELKLCREALRRERVARWERQRDLLAVAEAREPVDRGLLRRLAGGS